MANIRNTLVQPRGDIPAVVEALPGRRNVLKLLAAGGIGIPTLCLSGAMASAAPAPPTAQSNGWRDAVPAASPQTGHAEAPPRVFADPLLELMRLLRGAADIEHAAVLEYTYAAFSLKPDYESISGYYSDDAMSLLTIAIDRMVHLGTVNRMLVALGAPPRLAPPAFPFSDGAASLTFNLEPLSRDMLARYIYREAPQAMFDGKAADAPDGELAATICRMLDVPARPPAGIYPAIAAVAGEVGGSSHDGLPDITRWTDALGLLEDRGREARFEFLKGLFPGSHPAFAGHGDVWRLPIADAGYPSRDIVRISTGNAGRTVHAMDPTALALSHLGNLQYGTALLLLDLYFRYHLANYRSMAVTHMMGPVRAIGKHLAHLGAGKPFEAIAVPDPSVLNAQHRLRFVMALLQEGQAAAEAIGPDLPPDYPLAVNRDTMARLREIDTRSLEPRR